MQRSLHWLGTMVGNKGVGYSMDHANKGKVQKGLDMGDQYVQASWSSNVSQKSLSGLGYSGLGFCWRLTKRAKPM